MSARQAKTEMQGSVEFHATIPIGKVRSNQAAGGGTRAAAQSSDAGLASLRLTQTSLLQAYSNLVKQACKYAGANAKASARSKWAKRVV